MLPKILNVLFCFGTCFGDSFTPSERFDVLMEATGGGKVMPKFDVNDFIEIIGKPESERQKADFKLVVHFTSLAKPQKNFHCAECQGYIDDLKLVMQNTVQGEGMEKIFYLYFNYTQEIAPVFKSLKIQQVPTTVLLNSLGEGYNPENILLPGTPQMNAKEDVANQLAIWLRSKSVNISPFSKPINWKPIVYKTVIIGWLLCVIYSIRGYLISKHSAIIMVILFCAFTTSGAAFLKIRNAKFGEIQSMFDARNIAWLDSIAIVSVKMMFMLGILLLNWKNNKRAFTSTIGLVLVSVTYISYWSIYKVSKPHYPYSPYDML